MRPVDFWELRRSTCPTQVHSNRAQAYLKQKKYIQCISDAQQALSLDPTQVKAAYRGAVACRELKLFARSAKFARYGLKVDPDSKDLSKVMGQAIDALKKSRERREKEKLEDHGETAEVDSALEDRSISIGPVIYDFCSQYGSCTPVLDHSSGLLLWPILFLYDSVMQTDWQKSVREDVKLKQIAKDMFPNKGCVPWDTKKEFVYSNFQAYLECYAEESDDTVVMVKLNTLNIRLGKILKGRRLVGMAVFHLIPKTDVATIERFEDENRIEMFQEN
ncbi:Tetratricopeptide repeat protein 4 [Perkinsus olseni]|uniref:Tetratricopeptide repeat protein 4 n=1 Tax=Perkinsus olseni TaxID=32597 RepID=A0A7J6PFW2_PEROL|nr:Tetratricopeptide repeat protein 4 [Perkinsus olseni]